MKQTTIPDPYFDEGLQQVLDGRFTDSTAPKNVPAKKPQNVAFKATGANEGEATRAKSGRVRSLVKWVAVFIVLSFLILYWWTDKQMATTAAVPSLYVCGMFLGGSIGRYAKKEANYESH